MNTSPRPLAFYLSPRDPQLARYAAWLAGQGIGLVGTNSILPHEAHLIPVVSELLQKHSLGMVSVHSELGLLAGDGQDALLRPQFHAALQRAHTWGAECVVYHFRSIQQPWKPTIWWEENAYIQTEGVSKIDDRQVETLNWLCEQAQALGMGIALENVQNHFAYAYRVEEIARLVDRVGAPNLGICLDSGHAHLSGVDVPGAIRTAGHRLMTTHFHDSYAGVAPRASLHDADLHLVPGLGTIDWPEVIRAMDDVAFQGPVVFEGPRIPGEPDSCIAWELTMRLWAVFVKLAETRPI